MSPQSPEGQVLHGTRADHLAYWASCHGPGPPPAPVKQMIDRLGWLALHLSLFDKDGVKRGMMSPRNSRTYLAYVNSERHLTRQFYAIAGQPQQAKPARTFAEHKAAKRAAEQAAAA